MNLDNQPDENTVFHDGRLTLEQRLSAIIFSHRAAVKASMVSAITALLCAGLLAAVLLMHQPVNRYFATTTDGRLFNLTPLTQPVESDESIPAFAGRVITNTFTFDYVNYRKTLAQVANDYTPAALTAIKQDLEKSGGVVKEAIANKWVVTANLMAAPQLIHQGIVPQLNAYGWRLRLPLMITFQSETQTTSARYYADVTVLRVDQRNHPQGVQIATLQLTSMS